MTTPVGTCTTLSTVPPAPAPRSPRTLNSSFRKSPNGPASSPSCAFGPFEEEVGFFFFEVGREDEEDVGAGVDVDVDVSAAAERVDGRRVVDNFGVAVDDDDDVVAGMFPSPTRIPSSRSPNSSVAPLTPGCNGAFRTPRDLEISKSIGFFLDILDFPAPAAAAAGTPIGFAKLA